MHLVLSIFILSLCSSLVRSQVDEEPENIYFTSLPGMEWLLQTERELLLNLENYANALESRVKVMQRAIAAMRAENLKSVEDTETYLSNPLNSFALIRRMHTDWIYWELFMQNPVGRAEIDINQKLRIKLPKSTDMDLALAAISRLESTYYLQPIEIAAGLLNGKQYNASLSSRDCYEIGQRLFSRENILHSSHWLYVALLRYEENEVNAILGFDKLQIYELYMETFLRQNRYETALEILHIALFYSPNNAKYLRAKSLIEHEIKTSKEKKDMQLLFNDPFKYFRCCRGEHEKRLSRLHCRYNTTTHPFLKLAPFKMEELQMDPYIVFFYDVLSDAEIAEIKEMALPHLTPATVYNKPDESNILNEGRTSQYSYIEENMSDTKERVKQRIIDLSGFDLQGSEDLNVVNYVLGAHYIPHYDFYNVSEDAEAVRGVGDRIATVLFYLSDVDQGGSTVFPNLEIVVQPRKGSALMWYNLNNRGEMDERTLHGACPVIVGSKWIVTQWIRERAQVFRRPCFV